MPSLVGEPGRAMSGGYIMKSMTQVCISHEFSSWALNRTSPVISWLRALARDLHAHAGGPGVGAVGMCFSGGFALAMAIDDEMLAPVLSQPSMPFAVGKARSHALGLSDADLGTRQGTRRARRPVRARPALLQGPGGARRALGPVQAGARRQLHRGRDRLVARQPERSQATAHSVLTEELVDQPGHPTKDALDRVLAFFRDRLTV